MGAGVSEIRPRLVKDAGLDCLFMLHELSCDLNQSHDDWHFDVEYGVEFSNDGSVRTPAVQPQSRPSGYPTGSTGLWQFFS